jgi:hypothetical protein
MTGWCQIHFVGDFGIVAVLADTSRDSAAGTQTKGAAMHAPISPTTACAMIAGPRSLADLATEIRAAHEAVRMSARQMLGHAIRAGDGGRA